MSIEARCLVAVLLTGFGCGEGFAQGDGFYIGAGAGQSKGKAPSDCTTLAGFFDPGGFSCDADTSETAWKIFAGYEVNPYFALEASYVSLGTFKFKASGTAGGLPASADVHDRRYGFSGDAIVTVPLSREFALLARVGVSNFTVQSSISSPTSESRSERPSGNKLDFGLGAKYGFTRNVAAQVEYQRFRDIADSSATGKSDVDLISGSLIYRFR